MSSSVEDIGGTQMQPSGFANFLDRASTELLRMEEQNSLPDGISVHPALYEMMAVIRRRELDDGYPLIVLGMTVQADAALQTHEYRLTTEQLPRPPSITGV
jgi:hypothetical protein